MTAVWHEPGVRWLTPVTLKASDTTNGRRRPAIPLVVRPGSMVAWDLASSVSRPGRVPSRVLHGAAPALEEDGEEPRQLPDEFVPALEEYALYELQQREGETDKALFWWGKYKEREKALEQHMAHRVTTARTGAIGRV